jgi:hypothetical protein
LGRHLGLAQCVGVDDPVHQAPDYPMQMMVAVFDFPDKASSAAHAHHVPELAVDYVRGPLTARA